MRSLRPVAGLVLCLLVLGALGAAQPGLAAGGTTCSAGQLVPALGDAMVNQGVGNYAYLVRGKETVVKFFLTGPTNCTMSSSQSINVTAASLTVSSGGVQVGTPVPSFQSFGNAPAVTATLSTTSPADPVFAVPSTDLTVGDGSSTFAPTFTARIAYSVTSGKTTTTGLSATFTKTGVTFDKKTNALRVLVVPMGDATAGVLASTQYTSTDQTSTQNGFSALSRIFPVPSGVSDLAGTGGIRYVIDDAAMVNLKAVTGAYVNVNGTSVFCGTSGNFDAVKAQLAQFMQSWNSLSTNPPVDRVLGVVGAGVSIGPDNTSFNCADGMASVVSPEAWVRAIPDQPASGKTPAVPSRTGSLMAMELAHTWGSADESTTYHSPNVSAAPNTSAATSGYNVTTRSFLSTNRSAMKYSFTTSPPWDDSLTLLEPTDYSQDRCALGGTVTGLTECAALSTQTGTNFGVAAAKPFIVSGTIDSTSDPETADIVQSGFLASQTIGAQDDSPYRYVRRNATTGAKEMNLGFHVSFVNSLHGNGSDTNDGSTTQHGLFSFALPDDPSLDYSTDPAEVQIWKVTNTSSSYDPSTASGDTLLYDRKQQASPPSLTGISIAAGSPPINFTNTSGIDEVAPQISDNGKWLAWQEQVPNTQNQVIYVAPTTAVNDPSKWTVVPTPAGVTGARTPAWNPAGTALAYEGDGDIYTQTVDLSGAAPSFGTPTKVYDQKLVDGEFTSFFPASHPSWSGDGSQLAIAISNGDSSDVDAIPATVPATGPSTINTATPLTDTGVGTEPSWSHTPGDNRVAFTYGGSEIHVVDASAPDPTATDTSVSSNGNEPFYGTNGRIAFQVVEGSGIWTIGADGSNLTQITVSGADSNPSMGGNRFAFNRSIQSCVFDSCFAPLDIMLTSVGTPQHVVTFTATSTASLKGELDYLCNGLTYPVQVGLDPSEFSGNEQTFFTNFDGSDACGGGTLVARVTDGVQYGSSDSSTPITGTLTVDPKPPTAAIYAPNDQIYGIGPYFGGIAANGTGYDAEGRILPATGLHWTLKFPDGSVRDLGNFSSSDVPAPAGGWPAGTYTFTLVATDGNNVASAPMTRNFHIGYVFGGGGAGGAFLPPLVNPPHVNTGSPGSQYPIKWQLKDSSGKFVSDLGSVSSIQYQTDGDPGHCDFTNTSGPMTPLTTGGTVLRYDTKNNQFVYNWTTPPNPGCYVFELTLSDGTEHDAWFALS
jgi:hypothetical protein